MADGFLEENLIASIMMEKPIMTGRFHLRKKKKESV